MSKQTVELILFDGSFVRASLLDDLGPEYLLVIEREWSPVRFKILKSLANANVPQREWPQSLHWDWKKKAAELRLLEARGMAITCEGKWQGAMLTKSATKRAQLGEARGKHMVYIDYLEAAPWNWSIDPLEQKKRFKGVGSVLFRAAVELSFNEGFYGRVGLHALPQAEGFYVEACGMTSLGRDSAKHGLIYYELTSKMAEELKSKGGGKSQ